MRIVTTGMTDSHRPRVLAIMGGITVEQAVKLKGGDIIDVSQESADQLIGHGLACECGEVEPQPKSAPSGNRAKHGTKSKTKDTTESQEIEDGN